MAKLNEDMVVIKVSELLKDSDPQRKILDQDIVSTIEAAVQELVGAGKLVEIIQEENNGVTHAPNKEKGCTRHTSPTAPHAGRRGRQQQPRAPQGCGCEWYGKR